MRSCLFHLKLDVSLCSTKSLFIDISPKNDVTIHAGLARITYTISLAYNRKPLVTSRMRATYERPGR